MATYTLISSNVLTSSAASVTFSSIPATYTDLVIRSSARNDSSGSVQCSYKITINSDSGSNYSFTTLRGSGTAASSTTLSSQTSLRLDYQGVGGTATSNTFGSSEIYIPNYLSTSSRPIGVFGAGEDNATTAFRAAIAGLYRGSSAITSIVIADLDANNFVSGSSFYLYGISNA